ncbi:MAG: response regulator transcription factor [Anaerolineae bacterium]|nr:response regulator transcription factor [Anaerolineae bacterium]
MNVFVVEDSSLLRERLIRTLNEIRGIQVSGFSDTADEAIQLIEQARPDAIILDIRLRQGNGYQVLQKVKSPGKPPLVIILTNFAYPQYRKRYLDAGADFFFDKSNEFDKVVLVLSQYLKRPKSSSDALDA